MARRLLTVSAVMLLGLAGVFAAHALAGGKSGVHRSGCHSAHSCPSDHHTYVWYDGNGQGWDCAEPGAPELNGLDTTLIVYDGRTYYCHMAGGATTTAATSTQATTATTTAPTTTASPAMPAFSTGV